MPLRLKDQLYATVNSDAAYNGTYKLTFPNKAGTIALTSDVPTVNNATLTIQKNGTNVQTFTANQSTNATANITVPTKTSELTNNSNFVADASYVHTDNNYTTTEKNKLSGIAAGAEVNVQANWTQTTTTADDYIKNKPTLATVATSGSYNDLSNKPTIPAAQVQSNWTQTTTTAVDYIKNKPTLATVATSGSYNDLSNKPTIPTVNNATLTIQKNGTNVQTFTANQSTNATANITVPTNTNELTNGAGFITSSGTAAKANQLTTARTIAISGGATGTATSFNGTSNISIPVTKMYETYLDWGNQNLSGRVSCVDAALSEEFSANRIAYMDASKITVEYSRDGGSTWTDYGLTNAQKVGLVTTSQAIYTGGTNSNAASNYQVRVDLHPTNPYMATRKLFVYISTGGVSNAQVLVERKGMSDTAYTTVTTATISGWSGWNSIPINITFGGTANWSNSNLRLTFSYNGKSADYPNAQLNISKIRLYGETAWSAPSNLATNGHLYTYDTSQNATFPADVSVTGSLKHGNYTYTLPNKTGTVAMTSDIPSVPTVNNGQLTIQKNGTNVATFTANQSGNATANITVPTKTSDLTNDSNFVASTSLATVATSGSYNDLSNKPTIPTVNNATLTIQKNGTNVQTFTANQSTNATANITVPTKISDLTNTSGGFITYCTCSTAAATAAKVVTLDSGDSNWVLRKGAIIGVKFTNSNTASSVTLNVNSSGAKSIYYNNAAYTGSSNSICGYASRYTFYMYDGTYWVWISDGRHDGNDNTYTTAYCSTAAGTAAKAASMTGYTLTANRYTVITFTNANSAASALTLNINSKGAKPLYINGAASSSSNHTLAAGSYIVYYDGTNYYINNNGEIPRMIHSDSPVPTSSVTQVVSNAMIQDGTITFAKTATGEFLKLQTTTTDPGAGSALAANTLLGVYEA